MFKAIASLLMVIVFAIPAVAQDKFKVPEQKILNADKVHKLGRLVKLDVSPIAEKPEHYVSTDYKWNIYEILYDDKRMPYISVLDDMVPVDNGVFFGAGIENRKLTAQLIAVHTYAVKDKDGKIVEVANRINTISAMVTIGGDTPTPPGPGPGPGPGPNPPPPGPDPVFPDGRFKLAKTAYDLAVKTVTKDRAKGASSLARGCEGVAASIAAGVLSDPATILKTLRDKNNANLKEDGVDVASWDAFGTALQQELLALYRANKLAVASDYADAFREMAEGLKKVK